MLSPLSRMKGSTAKRVQRIAGPTCEPISFELQKTAAKIGNINTGAYNIQNKIATARRLTEGYIHRCLVQQMWDLFLDVEAYVGSAGMLTNWFENYGGSGGYSEHPGLVEITLPLPPVQQVIEIGVTDNSGIEVIVDPAAYSVSRSKEPCRIRLNAGYTWPPHRGFESFRVRFTAGYATPFNLSSDSDNVILASRHGFNSGDLIQLSSLDGTLPGQLQVHESYTITNLTASGFQVLDQGGNLVALDPNWPGTGFIGEIPANAIEAMVLLSGLNQGGEQRPKVGDNRRNNAFPLPVDPYELMADLVWPVFP